MKTSLASLFAGLAGLFDISQLGHAASHPPVMWPGAGRVRAQGPRRPAGSKLARRAKKSRIGIAVLR